eukprot:6174441-Pleurochrysis_carterae.AAC.1
MLTVPNWLHANDGSGKSCKIQSGAEVPVIASGAAKAILTGCSSCWDGLGIFENCLASATCYYQHFCAPQACTIDNDDFSRKTQAISVDLACSQSVPARAAISHRSWERRSLKAPPPATLRIYGSLAHIGRVRPRPNDIQWQCAKRLY